MEPGPQYPIYAAGKRSSGGKMCEAVITTVPGSILFIH